MYRQRPTIILLCATVAAMAYLSCKKKKAEYVSPYPRNLTSKMGSVRKWVGTKTFGFFPTTTTDDTENFALPVINDATVVAFNDTLHYISYDEGAKSMYFKAVKFPDSATITYYYEADSMAYYIYSRATTCCFYSKTLQTTK